MNADVTVERRGDHLLVQWSTPRSTGSARFDRLPDTVPEWLGSADDLLEGASRRDEAQVLDALARWAAEHAETVGIWHDGGGVEVLGAD